MTSPGLSKPLAIWLTLALAAIGAGCTGSEPPVSQRAADSATAADSDQPQQRDADALIEENFNEGPELPAGWPADLIPLPAGAAAVASLSRTSIPGNPGTAAAVLYSAPQSPEEIQQFLVRELPRKGWRLLHSSPTGETMTTAAQGNGYLGIFSSGDKVAEGNGADSIKMQVILAEVRE